jgi:hypothetical protein
MHRRLIAISLAGAALATTTGCDRDVVVANARNCSSQVESCAFVGNLIQASVQSDAAGQGPTGGLQYDSGLGMGRGHIEAQATCLNVAGNTAIVGWTGTVSGYLGRFYLAGLARLRDLGPRDSGRDTYELVRGDLSQTPVVGPTTCSSYPGPFPNAVAPVSNNVEGDVFVFDAPVGSDGVRGVLSR